MKFKTKTSPFYNSTSNVNGVMLQVLLALMPGTVVMSIFFGWGILFNIVLAILFALALETIALKVRHRPIKPFISDLSAIVAAWLFALSLPPLAPWWIVFIGIFFAIIVAKHLYGGIGYNPFNPAMVGYAVLIVSFPFEMSQWINPNQELTGFLDSIKIVFAGNTPVWDAITAATPLDDVKTGFHSGINYSEIASKSAYLQNASQNTWLWSSLAFAVGGAWLLFKKIIHWQIPLAVLGSLTVVSTVFYLFSSSSFASPWFHIISGATILGAFFIATDPVSASTTPIGKLIYGASIGALIYIIRNWGSYPDAIAFAVLIVNMAVPIIDYYTQPRVLGHKKKALIGKGDAQ
ncbi:UNVERIFIED_CONTAM: hypothetical protein GTU68_019509 [Idotea baltica]|nr:hypothetical protein [Idotea baltica]